MPAAAKKGSTKRGRVLECLSGTDGVKRVGSVYEFDNSPESKSQVEGPYNGLTEYERLVKAGHIEPAG